MASFIPASKLQIGQPAVIAEISDNEVGNRLIDMGCLPGEKIELDFKAPAGDPVAFRIGNAMLAMRMEEAQNLIVEVG